MTQVSRYGHMLKVTVNGMRMRVTARYRVDGSVLNDTIEGRMLGAETTLEVDSPDPPERVAKVVRNAERGCFVLQALQNPVPVTARTMLNGVPLELEAPREGRLGKLAGSRTADRASSAPMRTEASAPNEGSEVGERVHHQLGAESELLGRLGRAALDPEGAESRRGRAGGVPRVRRHEAQLRVAHA